MEGLEAGRVEGLEGLLAVAQRVVKPVQELDPGFLCTNKPSVSSSKDIRTIL